MPTVLVLNSLDARYGSTYRIRALAKLLETLPDWHVVYVEHQGSALQKLNLACRASMEKFDILLTQKFNPITLSALTLCKLRHIPTIVDWDDFDAGLQDGKIKTYLAELCERMGPTLCNVITTHSQTIFDHASQKRKTFFVQQGYDPSCFYTDVTLRNKARADLGFKESDFVVGHVCTFTTGGAMDLDSILEAFSRVENPNTKFILIGGGPLQRSVEVKLQSLNLSHRIHLTGLVPQEQAAYYLRALDLGVVFMSDKLANRVRASFKVIEYLASGIPIVGKVVGETLARFGEYIHKSERSDLAATIEQLATREISPKSHPSVTEYSWAKSLPSLEAALNHAMNKRTVCN